MSDTANELDQATRLLRNDPEQSLEICERYVEAHPDDPDGLFSRFQALDSMDDYERALADINRVLELDPNSGGYSSRGQFFHRHGEYERAVSDLTKARELSDYEWRTSFDPHFRADSFARLGRLDEALADCEFIPEDHWMPGVFGLPAGNKDEFIAEIRRRALQAQRGQTMPR